MKLDQTTSLPARLGVPSIYLRLFTEVLLTRVTCQKTNHAIQIILSLKLLKFIEDSGGTGLQMLQLSTHLKTWVRMLSARVAQLNFPNPNHLICVLSRIYNKRRLQSKGYFNIELPQNKDSSTRK